MFIDIKNFCLTVKLEYFEYMTIPLAYLRLIDLKSDIVYFSKG